MDTKGVEASELCESDPLIADLNGVNEWCMCLFLCFCVCYKIIIMVHAGAMSLTQSEGRLWFNKRAGKTNAHTHTSKHKPRHIQSTCGTEQALFWACLFTWECFLTFHVVLIVWSGTRTKTGVSRGSKERKMTTGVSERWMCTVWFSWMEKQ